MKAAKKPPRKVKPKVIYQLRVALERIEPSIWRRLWIADTLTLAKLNRVIQTAMGWTNSHLHEFTINGLRYGMPDDEWASEGDETMLDDRRHTIGALLGIEVPRFAYLYDFGDHWQHTVAVEQLMSPNELNTRPTCLDGQNACPPEDVGGVGGYIEFLEAIRDPTHEEHVAMWEWGGGPFDSTGFDRNAVNAALRKLRL
jgi:hypothetical protein